MPVIKGTTAQLAEWAASFRLQDAPDEVVERMKALVLDLLRVCAVGARLPWSRAARKLQLELGLVALAVYVAPRPRPLLVIVV